jgi:CSLREA domain-containing protein
LQLEILEERQLLAADATGLDLAVPTSNSLLVWANNGEDKIAREELRAASDTAAVRNSVWNGTRIELFGARNEIVSFNLVLEAPVANAAGINVSFRELTGPSGARIAAAAAQGDQVFDYVDRNIELFFVRYLEIEGLSVSAYDLYDERHVPERLRLPHDMYGSPDLSYAWHDRPDHNRSYPEIAVPLELVGDFAIAAGRNQSVWCDVYIPKDAPPGTYTGVVEVRQSGTIIYQVPVQLQVHAFSLPDESSTDLAIFVSRENINARLIGQAYPSPGTPAYASSVDALLQVHKLAHRHRISLLEGYTPTNHMDTYWLSVLNGEAFTAQRGYDGPGQGVGQELYVIGTYGSWPWQNGDCATMWSQLNGWASWFDTQGLDTELFLYLMDEPATSAQLQQVETWSNCMGQNPGAGRRIESLATVQLPLAATQTPSLQNPVSLPRASNPQDWEPLSQQYAPLWMYNGRRPFSGSLATEDDGISPRTLGWIMHRTDVGSWFLWEGTYWNNFQGGTGPTDVFNQAMTFGASPYLHQHLGKTSWMYGNGDGVLFYPGTDMTGVGPSYGVAGVFSSLRLKHARRGLQDAEYLAMAAAIDAAGTQQIVNQVLPKALWEYGVNDPQDPTWVRADISWSNDPDVWEQARSQLAAIIDSGHGRVLVVNSTSDASDANIGDGVCDDGTGFCTLRAAIQEANALANLAGGPDVINFAIPGTGPHTIRPLSALPAITDPVVIDGTTQPGYAGTPLIELDGSLAGAGVSGLRFETGGNTVKGLAINRFAASGILVLTGGENTIQGNFLGTNAAGTAAAPNAASGIDVRTAGNLIGGAGSGEGNLISGNANFGILLLGGAAENTIVGNRIGTDQTGTAAIGNALYGIYVTSPGNQIGGPAAGDGNLISGNLRGGVAITGATATGNVVQGNRTGTTADGHAALPNGNAGITVSNVSGNTIGGTAAGAGNVLSGNALHGAMIVGAASTNNVVQGNLVGLNAAGTAAVPNGQYGITNYSPTSMIGGPAAGAGNTVSGNNYSGVLVYTPTAMEVKVQGNRIGTNAAGTAAVPNGFYGVYVNSTDNLIGGAAAGEGNLISGNTRGGVALTERTAQRNVVQGNRIGTNPAGTAALANGGSGVTIAEGSNNTIGGTAAGAGNQISGNAAQGVIVVGVNATGNAVLGNLVGTNGAGTAAVANGQYGVAVYSSNTTIGGAGSGNTISGNASGGVIVYGTTVTGTTVQGNRIGTDSTGSLAVANGGHGVFVVASNSLIGGSATGEGNVIGWNASSGVYVAGATSAGNAIRQNSIYRNGFWGIDLAPWGPTANDPEDADTGANNGQNFPELASAVLSGGTLSIAYSVPSSTANSAYPLAVEFFLADADGQEGQTYLGGESYPAPGSDSVALTVSGLSAGQRVVATATDANGNTSEFSSSVVVAAALLAPETMDGATSATLDAESLTPVVWQAIATWELAGLDAVRVASLHTVTFEIADLPGRYLAWATPDRIVLDIDAAGYGWYVASEAGSVADGFGSSDSQSQMDLLTAVMHELGHVLGLADLEDEDDDLMADILQPNRRRLPTADDIDRVLAADHWLD